MEMTSILEELRHTREQLLANAGGTLAGLVAQIQQDECRSGRKILATIDLPRNRRTMECREAAEEANSNGSETATAH